MIFFDKILSFFSSMVHVCLKDVVIENCAQHLNQFMNFYVKIFLTVTLDLAVNNKIFKSFE